jgi:hypothetical protein
MLGFNRLRLCLSARVGAVNHDFPMKGSARYAECAIEDQSCLSSPQNGSAERPPSIGARPSPSPWRP